MFRTTLTVAAVGVCTSTVFADVPPLTLNFANQTSTRVNVAVTEDSANEKDTDFGDFDNDGDLDFVVAAGSSDFGQRRNQLFRNDGGVFNEVSGAPIISGFSSTDVTRNVFFRDYNNDGWLDIYVINDDNSGGFSGADHLYINMHPGGVFSHFSDQTAMLPASGQLGASCGGVSLDFDQDGDIDVYSGNYPGPSQDVMVRNNSNGASYSNVTSTHVPSDGDYTVDVAAGDMNGDGKVDLLISNWDTNWIYYNDKNGEGGSTGDYRYSGSQQSLGGGGADENSMEPADFDNDGKMDFYWSNGSGSQGDLLYHNTGNNGAGKAQFDILSNLPAKVNGQVSRKATLGDFNDDGKVDLFVMTENGTRPVVLRNTSLPGAPSFVDWTNGLVFPANSSLRGWHASAFDSNGDSDTDIFVGAFTGNHLFERVPANEVDEASLLTAPVFFNRDPVAISGDGSVGDTDVYDLPGVLTGHIAAVVNGVGDYRLELRNAAGTVVASSDRGAIEVEEAFQVTTTSQAYTVEVTILDCGRSNVDFNGDCNVGFSDLNDLLANWGPCPGGACPWDSDNDSNVGFTDLNGLLGQWGALETGYLLEVLGRSN